MNRPRRLLLFSGFSALIFSGFLIGQQSERPARDLDQQLPVEHPECSFFGPQRERFVTDALQRLNGGRPPHKLSDMTNKVVRALAVVPGGSQTATFDTSHAAGSIDSYIFGDLQKNNITPAPPTTDWEFIRRVTLDLTGRIPTPDRVLTFVADTAPDKRAKLIDELIASPTWVDKWTMYFGDLYQNTDTKASTALRRFPQGRNAFYKWIHDSLAGNTPYN